MRFASLAGFLLFGYFLCNLLASCSKNEIEAFYITFSPPGESIMINTDSVKLNLSLFSEAGSSGLTVYLWSDFVAEQKVFEKVFSGAKQESLDLVLRFTPTFGRGTVVYGKFVFVASDGNRIEYLKRFILSDEVDVALATYYNEEFFSSQNKSYNGYSLSSLEPVSQNQGITPDLAELDNDTIQDPNVLTYRWFSPSGCGIVKASNLDFNTITKDVISVTFDASVPLQYTDSLEIGDIYIFKKVLDNVPLYYLVRITDFEGGTVSARYIFDVKK
jgi:hypothetical protein